MDNWIFSGGILANKISESDLGINYFPGIEVSYTLMESVKLFTSYNTSLRMPTFTDLYYSGPTNIGNPDLKPEKSKTIEGGIKLKSDLIEGHAVVYLRNGTDIIDWIKQSNDDVWQPMNLTKLKSFGSEFYIQLNLRKKFGRNFPNKLTLSYFNNNLNREENDYISNYVLDNLKHKIVGDFNQSLTKSLTLDVKFIYQDREGSFTKFYNGSYGNEVEYRTFCLVDSKLTYKLKSIGIYVSVSNLFNAKYYDLGNVIQPGRWLKTGISYKFDFEKNSLSGKAEREKNFF